MLDNPVIHGEPVTAPYAVDVSRGECIGTVSSQWFSRPDDQKFLSLDELFATTKARADASRTDVIDAEAIEVVASADDGERLDLKLPTGHVTKPTNWSFGQACSLVKAPAGYLTQLPAKLAGVNLQYGLKTYRGEKVKTYTNGADGSVEIRAFTSSDYGRIFDWEFVEAIKKVADEGPWKGPGVLDWSTGRYNPNVPVSLHTTTLFASDRDVFFFLVDDLHPIEIGKLKDGRPDLVFRGVYGWNSEVGARSGGIASMYLRGVCANRNLWGCEGFKEIRLVHSKFAPKRFAAEILPALESFSKHSPDLVINGVRAAKEAVVATTDDERKEFLHGKVGLSKKAAADVMALVLEEEGQPAASVWDMVQGITAYARRIPHQDERVNLETKGKKLLDKVTKTAA